MDETRARPAPEAKTGLVALIFDIGLLVLCILHAPRPLWHSLQRTITYPWTACGHYGQPISRKYLDQTETTSRNRKPEHARALSA
ncbi:hypothetical protein FB451DRAFT_1110374 [Mycena latifolia]|nr:hypothetical protein FB451DRAFT_1110374 [Mycena latifolia]